MRKLSNKFRQALYFNNYNYQISVNITLQNKTVLNLTNSEIWNDGFGYDDAVSDDESFTALGSAIIRGATLIINNMNETYSTYDFTNARVHPTIALNFETSDGSNTEKIELGEYTVDDTSYNGALITLSLLDNMEQFDRPYKLSKLKYPATLDEIIRDSCTNCGVTLATYDFPHKSYTVSTRPEDESTTFREVISWVAGIAGCFARCNDAGKLELKWFDQTTLENWNANALDGGTFNPWTTGDNTDGGTFNPWTTGDNTDGGTFEDELSIHYIHALYSQNVGVDDVVITGIRIIVKSDNSSDLNTHLFGSTGYVIEIENNQFITDENVQEIGEWLRDQLVGLTFRKATITHTSDPSIEAGDVAIVIDRKENIYPILVTRSSFTIGTEQTTICGAETPSRNSATRYTSQTKSYVEMRKLLNKEQTAREQNITDLNKKLDEKSGLYTTVETTESGNIYYLHDRPELKDSEIIWKVTTDAFGISTDGGNTWNIGLTVDGVLIAKILDTIGLNFDWGTGGTLTLGGKDNANGLLKILDADGDEIGRWSNTGISILNGSINILSNFVVDNQGNVTTKSLKAIDYISVDGGDNSKIKIPIEHMLNRKGYIELSKNGLIVNTDKDVLTNREKIQIGGKIVTELDWGTEEEDIFGIRCYANSGAIGSSTDITPTKYDVKYKNTNGEITKQSYMTDSAIYTTGTLTVRGTKNRLVDTEDYSSRKLYCYETASPYFGDIGEGIINDDGLCYITIDPTFSETISITQYQIFLQKYGEGECYVKERLQNYFIVSGTPKLEFGWEIKAKQYDFDQYRLEKHAEDVNIKSVDYIESAQIYIDKLRSEREVIL